MECSNERLNLNDCKILEQKILTKICENYYAIYILDTENGVIIPYKRSRGVENFAVYEKIPWEASLVNIVTGNVQQHYVKAVCDFLYFKSVKNLKKDAELVYLQNTDNWMKMVVRPLEVGDGLLKTALLTIKDVTQSKHQLDLIQEENARIKDASEHDELTDLFNRTKLKHMIQAEYNQLDSCGVLFFDINNLKSVNDANGHQAGDSLICQAADSIRSVTNRRIHGYRYGGDEFLVVVSNPKEKELEHIIALWHARLKYLNKTSGIEVSIAVGKTVMNKPFSFFDIVNAADRQMYLCKKKMKREF